MPIYEYVCRDCGGELEKLQRISDEPLTDCPACGKPELVKKVSAAGFRLKGGGWYETDFKSSGKKNLAGDKKSETKPETKAESKSESKPAADSKPAKSATA